MRAVAAQKFGPEVLLIFLGHSSDADECADAIYGLESELQRLLDQHLGGRPNLPFKRVRMWEWRKDGLPHVGGQDEVVAAALKRANIAVFVFKERIGAVSWGELTQSRDRKDPSIQILAFFPTNSPPNLNDRERAARWSDLLNKKTELVDNWSSPNSKALRPIEGYSDEANLKRLATDQLQNAVVELLHPSEIANNSVRSEVFSTKFLGEHRHLNYDEQPVLIRSIHELDQDLLEEFLAAPLSKERNVGLKRAVSEQLENLRCLYHGQPTHGALLCFAQKQFLTGKGGCCELQMAIHDAPERGGERVGQKVARENLLMLFKTGMSWLTDGTVLRRKGGIGSNNRDELEIPVIVLREALANALIHRDYESNILRDQPTRIDVYPDKVEITSYGRLLKEVPLDLLNDPNKNLQPFRRNPVIAGIFQCMRFAELNASGVQRMRRVMTEEGLELPLFRTNENFVCVTLARPFELSGSREPIQIASKTAHSTRKAFISSTAELEIHRDAAIDACLRAGVIPIYWEKLPTAQKVIQSALMDMIDQADLYILILGYRYGVITSRDGISQTELEYNRAVERKLPILVFTMHADHPIRMDAIQMDAEGRERLKRFKENVSVGRLSVEFKSPEDLRGQIIKALASLPVPAPATKFTPIPADISRVIKYAPAQLIGREAETRLLDDAWAKAQNNEPKRPHVLTFVALGGEGKTSLVAKWAADLAHQDWPGCDAVFAWSFYSQGTREQVAASSDIFLGEALTFFGDPAMAGSAQGAFEEKGQRLAQLAGERRALLILDGLEPLQYAPTSPTPGELKDQGLAALLKGLAANNKGLCIVTTRYSLPNLRAYWQTTAPEVKLLRLSKEAGVELLRSLGLTTGTQTEFETLVEDVKGHALTLNLLGTWLRDAHAGDIRKRDLVRLEEADAEEQGGHAFHVMDAYARWFESEGKKGQRALAVLRLLGLFDRPADAGCLKALWKAPAIPDLTEKLVGMSEAQRNLAFTRLEDAKLLTVNRDTAGALLALDAHPLLREYFAQQIREQRPEAWRAAHRRLFEHLCATTKDEHHPTLDDLQPLYQAVAHGCQAGMQQEALDKVYRDRIQLGEDFYSAKILGALGSNLGAIACFFEQRWSRVSPALTEPDQGWVLNEAALYLRGLGRLTEALEPVRAGLKMGVEREDWLDAAIRASNLSKLELTLGELAAAVAEAEQAVTYADRGGVAFWRMMWRATHADALCQAGRRDEAEARFREAEEMQAEREPEYPLLNSLGGFQYCDLLLTAAERAAWRCMLQSSCVAQPSFLLESCHNVSQRATQTFKVAEGNKFVLDIGLDHLTLGRAALYAAILEGLPFDQLDPCRDSLQHAMEGLRRAGRQDYVACALLTRAWLRFLTGAGTGPESAQGDLDEAFEIAERGPMPLFLADIHLHRARLFGLSKDRPANYPWTSPQDDLTEARRLIEKHGYWRRKEELEDAEAAAIAVSVTP